MLIWMEAWSLAPMILVLAELQKQTVSIFDHCNSLLFVQVPGVDLNEMDDFYCNYLRNLV